MLEVPFRGVVVDAAVEAKGRGLATSCSPSSVESMDGLFLRRARRLKVRSTLKRSSAGGLYILLASGDRERIEEGCITRRFIKGAK